VKVNPSVFVIVDTLDSIFGKDFDIQKFPSKLDIAGNWRVLIENDEQKKYDLTMKTRVSIIQPGDHESWIKMNKEYKQEKLRQINEEGLDQSNTIIA